jgi:hypothetical protein
MLQVKLDLSESDADDSDLVDTAQIKRRTSILSREDLDQYVMHAPHRTGVRAS